MRFFKTTGHRKFSFTLVELLISLVLIAIIGSALCMQIADAYRAEQVKGLQKQIQALFTMASYYATINGDGADLIFRKDEHDQWIGYILVFNKKFTTQTFLPKSFSNFRNVNTIQIHNQQVQTARFRFFSWTGLSEISINEHVQNNPDQDISIICSTQSGTPCTIDIPWKKYSYVTTKFVPFPDEFYTPST